MKVTFFAALAVVITATFVLLALSNHVAAPTDPAIPDPPAGLVVYRDARPLMGTIWEITIAERGRTRQSIAEIADAAFAEVDHIENLLSDWREGTELNNVNRNAGIQPFAVTQTTYDVVDKALHYSTVSNGAFDVTFNALWGVWDFNRHPPVLPDPATIGTRLPLIDYREVQLDPLRHTIFLRKKGMKIGLGGIAKGYTVDRVCALLENHKLKNYIVVGGGDMRVSGSRGEAPWHLAIQHPRREGYLYSLDVSNAAISTSGDYERYFILNGIRYHHIINPRTGYPAEGVCSVTIVEPHAASVDADAMSTSVFVLGVEKGLKLLQQTGMEGIIVDDELHPHLTKGLEVTGGGPEELPSIRLTRERE